MSTPSSPPSQVPSSAEAGGTARRRTRKRALIAFFLILLVCAGVAAYYYLTVLRWVEETDDAYVQGDIVTITPQTGGTVTRINVEDGMRVEAGQVLVEFDPVDQQVALEQARAALAASVRQVRGLHRTVDAGEANIAVQQAAVEQARQDLARRTVLAKTGAISAEELAHSRTRLSSAEAALAAARASTARDQAQIDRASLMETPQVALAAAQLRAAYLARQRTQVIAPISGYIAKRSVQLGQRVAAGTPLMAVIPLNQVWVDANFKETQLQRLRLDQPVELTSELYGKDVVFHGRLVSLGLGTGGAFALLPPQNASGNWIKIVQRIPVRIELDKQELQAHPLRLGLTMSVRVDLRDEGKGLLPMRSDLDNPVHATEVYAHLLEDAAAEVDRIVHANLGQ